MDDERSARFEAAYDRAYGQITAYAVRRCDSPQDAADVVAETFTVAWRRVDELPEGPEATLWLYGVARKVLANHFRGDNRRRERTAELDAELADRYGHSPDTQVELDAIGRAFRSLPDDDRELLSVIFAVIGVPPGNPGGYGIDRTQSTPVGDDWVVWEAEENAKGVIQLLVTEERLDKNPVYGGPRDAVIQD
ncbi:RNA polymerase sigma factor [Nonomuraea sp. NPDC003560]|uniref:RNA polymerase sigma factor n=1 Tax=Nonomuraea sp. NPDC003560 TaxID=3364341 RepID=UPI0036972ABE